MIVAVVLVLLHAADGSDVLINVDKIASMRSPRAEDANQHFTDGVRCMLNTADGKFVTVRETCNEVREIINAQK